MDIVVGKEAAQTPSRFNDFSSIPLATKRGGAHYCRYNVKKYYVPVTSTQTSKQAVLPGLIN